MTQDAERIPVIVGVGQINDLPLTPDAGLDPIQLMTAALQEAESDARGDWLKDLDVLSVVDQMSFRSLNPVLHALTQAIGANPSHRFQTTVPMGDSPIMLLNEAANRIASGESKIAAVVGAEALRTAAQRAAAAKGGSAADHNAIRARHDDRPLSYKQRYGLAAPVDVYPLYENATRAAWHQSLSEGQAESGEIWSLFSQVAAENPGAWIQSPKTVEEIVTATANNRPIAFPYTKFMVANSSVNQGAGFIVTSLAMARARGVPEDKIIYVGMGAAAHEADDFLARDSYTHSAGMRVSLEETLRLNALTIADIDFAELYSCFPCVPKMARRIIGWPADRPATVFGGLTFGGGPIGNYMSHAVVSMVLKLRREGKTGLLFANGGFATHNHSILVSNQPIAAAHFPQNFDYQAQADALRGAIPPLDEDYAGAGIIETYTVFYDRTGAPRHGVVVARNTAGARFLAKVAGDDASGIALLSDGRVEPVGTSGTATRDEDSLLYWKCA